MKTHRFGLFFALALLAPLLFAEEAPEPEGDESRFLTRIRRLTFEGRRAGEGYFSGDGRKLVFQSERVEGNPFFQIFEMDLSTGDTRQVSPGQGKTTCAFIDPVSGDLQFASTHHDPRSEDLQKEEIELRESGQERRYAWDFDPEMEIYVADAETLALTRLTDVKGYDAEGNYSPDGKWIVFTSNRQAFEGKPSDETRKQLEVDPAYYAEIYLMRADGSEQRRLTTWPGYDGGPFFMPDGERILWRRFDDKGLVADVWTMKLDGSDQRQLTDFGSMSWAPFPHPSGDYVIFTSNKHGFENFELFIVDAAGTKQPVRVSFTDGFDGIPVFGPDGETLLWTATRKTKQGQLFLARWNHEHALAALRAAPARGESR